MKRSRIAVVATALALLSIALCAYAVLSVQTRDAVEDPSALARLPVGEIAFSGVKLGDNISLIATEKRLGEKEMDNLTKPYGDKVVMTKDLTSPGNTHTKAAS